MNAVAIITRSIGGGYHIEIRDAADRHLDEDFAYTLWGARRIARRAVALYNRASDAFREVVQ